MRIGLLVAMVLIATGFIFWKDISGIVSGEKTTKKTEKGKKNKETAEVSTNIKIVEKWDLPAELKEVSGIAYLDDQRFACVQDELGTIFIYNIATSKIEKEIDFAGTGDYEGITVKGNTAYVVRADGHLYEVEMNAGRSSVKEYDTPLTVKHNIEGLCYDKNNNRLLLAIKDDEPGNPGYKGVYSFDLTQNKLNTEPVYKIQLDHPVLASNGGKKGGSIMPSDIGIHPVTQEIYIVDGPKAKLLILKSTGEIDRLLELGKDFSQPEGISFSPDGQIFISNEGSKSPGNIIKVEVE